MRYLAGALEQQVCGSGNPNKAVVQSYQNTDTESYGDTVNETCSDQKTSQTIWIQMMLSVCKYHTIVLCFIYIIWFLVGSIS